MIREGTDPTASYRWIEVEKWPIQSQDFRKITHRFKGILENIPCNLLKKPARCQHVLDELCPKISSDTGFPFLKNYGNLVSFKLDAMEQSKFADFILSNCCLLLLSSHSILKASTCQHLDNWKLYHILLSLWFSFMPWSHVLKYTGVAIVYEQNSVCLGHGKTCNNDHMYVCMYVMIKIIILFKKSSTEFDLLNACIFGLRS